jgi:hypothetical protein
VNDSPIAMDYLDRTAHATSFKEAQSTADQNCRVAFWRSIELKWLTSQSDSGTVELLGGVSFVRNKWLCSCLAPKGYLMVHETTVERVTNRVWGIFSSLDHGIAGNNNRRALLRAYIASLAERGEHNADKLTVDGLVYLKNLTSHKKKPVKRNRHEAPTSRSRD